MSSVTGNRTLRHGWRIAASAIVALAGWQLLVMITQVPHFILPSPLRVIEALYVNRSSLLSHSLITIVEIVAGLALGTTLGIFSAILLVSMRSARRYALPLMVISQSLPVFAIAPLLTLWFGYGIASKIVMATLIIYFPVVASSYDGLRITPQAMLDIAHTMNARAVSVLLHIRLPAALPSISSGIKVGASVAPIGAVVGEWVGSSKGLGFLMLNANGRMQTDLMFAALLCLSIISVFLYSTISRVLDRGLYWIPKKNGL